MKKTQKHFSTATLEYLWGQWKYLNLVEDIQKMEQEPQKRYGELRFESHGLDEPWQEVTDEIELQEMPKVRKLRVKNEKRYN